MIQWCKCSRKSVSILTIDSITHDEEVNKTKKYKPLLHAESADTPALYHHSWRGTPCSLSPPFGGVHLLLHLRWAVLTTAFSIIGG